jgi:hypothetical protein
MQFLRAFRYNPWRAPGGGQPQGWHEDEFTAILRQIPY